jgi:glucose-specific phosphotransferase system IIA component
MISPMTGKVLSLDKVPDPIFSEKMMGDGLAIDPTKGIVVAPCDGKIIHVFPTKHAIGILTPEGLEILIHIGIDTVELNGKGFESFVEAEQVVKKGQDLIKVDLKYVKKHAKSLITPLIITNMDLVNNLSIVEGTVNSGKDIILNIEMK